MSNAVTRITNLLGDLDTYADELGAEGWLNAANACRSAIAEIERLTAALPLVGVQREEGDLRHAQRLAVVLWEKHWKAQSPGWKVGDNLSLVVDQIDNMVAGLVPASPRAEEASVTFCYVTYRACTASCLTREECAQIADQRREVK